jgi:hypothetical protein
VDILYKRTCTEGEGNPGNVPLPLHVNKQEDSCRYVLIISEKINSCTVYGGKTPRYINIDRGTGEHLPYDVVVEAAPAPHYTNLAG